MSPYPQCDRARLESFARADADLWRVLIELRALDLPDWLLFSGAIYQCVWNALTGRPAGHGIRDFDVGYFDADTSWDAEDAIIARVAAAMPEALRPRVEVRNQARVHLWFPQKFGLPYGPLSCSADALARFVAPAFAVGVRLGANDRLEVLAPFGLEDVFEMRVRPNPLRPPAGDWGGIVARLRARWPELRVEA